MTPRQMELFLKSRGWTKHGSWWSKFGAGSYDELFGLARAFEIERLRLVTEEVRRLKREEH